MLNVVHRHNQAPKKSSVTSLSLIYAKARVDAGAMVVVLAVIHVFVLVVDVATCSVWWFGIGMARIVARRTVIWNFILVLK